MFSLSVCISVYYIILFVCGHLITDVLIFYIKYFIKPVIARAVLGITVFVGGILLYPYTMMLTGIYVWIPVCMFFVPLCIIFNRLFIDVLLYGADALCDVVGILLIILGCFLKVFPIL